MSQPRKWDDQGCLHGWSNAPTPGSQDRTCLLLSLRSSGHRGPHPSLSLRSASGDESASARPQALLGSFPLLVPAGRQDCLHLCCHLRRQVGQMGPGSRRLPRRCSVLGSQATCTDPILMGRVGGGGSPCPGCRRTGPGNHAPPAACLTCPGRTGQT